MLVALVCGSLAPLTPSQLVDRAIHLLEDSWADVRPTEVEDSVDDLDDPAIARDAWGFRALNPAQSLDGCWPHLVLAQKLAEAVAETERRVAVGSDIRANRALFASPLLARHQETSLGQRSREGDHKARNALAEANTRWVLQITKAFHARGVLEFDDLFQAGCLGLLRAAEKFDPTLGYKFSTYSTWWIRQFIQRSIADTGRTIRVPVHIDERLRRLHTAEERLSQAANGDPPVERLAKEARLTAAQIEKLRQIPITSPLDDLDADTASDRTQPLTDEVVLEHQTALQVRALLPALPLREREILERRLGLIGEEETLEGIGRRLGLTRERVRQLQDQALKTLRGLLSS
jgi:RNA polymerase sigma factor (sigma-70 family)